MLLNAKLSSYDMDYIMTAIKEDLNSEVLTITKEKSWTASMRKGGGEYPPSHLQKIIEGLLNNAFKEGCKCGKGGFSPLS